MSDFFYGSLGSRARAEAWVKAAFALSMGSKTGPVGRRKPTTGLSLILNGKTHLGPFRPGPACGRSSPPFPSLQCF